MVEYWAPQDKVCELIDMSCFLHGEAEILKLKKMAIESKNVFMVNPSDYIPYQIDI